MNLAKFSVRKPVTIFVVVALVVLMGANAVMNIPIDLYPQINPPVLLISTTYQGAQPEQVEERITRPLESMLLNVSGLNEIHSTSSKGSSMITLNFDWGENLTEAANEARDKIEFIRKALPDEADSPMMFKFDTSMIPIMSLKVSGSLDQDELYRTAKDEIIPRFEQVDGVAMASLSGGQEQIVLISVDQNRLDALGLTLSLVASVIGSQNIDAGGGVIDEGNMTFSIKTTGEYKSLDEVAQTLILTTSSGRPVRIQDIGDVSWGHRDVESIVYVDHEPSLMISIQKQSGTNSVQVADNVLKALGKIDEKYTRVDVTMLYDSTQMIRTTLDQVMSSLLWGALFAVFVILLFMRNLRSMIIIGISIPLSLLFTITAMDLAGLTLNLFTLTGLILGLGMIVDSSIVILENIFRYREKGTKLKPSAILGAGEMTGAIVGSTLTTICVFLPMILYSKDLDIVGIIMKPLAFTIVISLVTSLVVAITLVPLMAAKFPKVYSRKQRPLKNPVVRKIDGFFEKGLTLLDTGYRKSIEMLVSRGAKSRRLSLIMAAVLIVAVILGSVMLVSGGLNMTPMGMEDSVILNIKMTEGTRLETTSETVMAIQEQIITDLSGKDPISGVDFQNYKNITTTIGGGGMFFDSSSEHKGSIEILLPPYSERVVNSEELKDMFREYFNLYPGIEFSFGNGSHMMGSSTPLDIKVMGMNLDYVMNTADEIKSLILEQADYVLEPNVDFDSGMPQLLINIDRQKAYEKGLNMMTIGREVLANIDGMRSSVFRQDGKEYYIYVRLDEGDRSQVNDLERVSVTSSFGKRIPISSFADVEVTTGPVSIKRENQLRTAHVTGKTEKGMTASNVNTAVMKLIEDNILLEDGITVAEGGDVEDINEMKGALMWILVLSFALVFAVMAAIFENFLDPFIIFMTLFTIPIGVGFIYFITGSQLSMFSVVGMVMLIGIVVNNGIVLVDYTNLLRGRGLSVKEAVIQAGENRLRPVLMTSLTTILGMVPMAFFPGEGSELVQPIGLTVVGGMSVSTILTLFIVPVVYVFFDWINVNIVKVIFKGNNDESVFLTDGNLINEEDSE